MAEFSILPLVVPASGSNGTFGSNGAFVDPAHNAIFDELYAALARRAAAAGWCQCPSRQHVYYTGTVPTNLTAAGFTDAAATTWKGGTDHPEDVADYAVPWYGVLRTDSNRGYPQPDAWYVFIDHPGYKFAECVKLHVGSWTNAGGMVFADAKVLPNLVTAGVLPSIDALKGRQYLILGFSYSRARHERVLEYADARHLADGVIQSLAANTNVTPALPASPAPGIFRPGTQRTQSFTNIVGQHFRTYDTGGLLRDAVIAPTSTASVWYLSGATWTANVDQPFLVCTNGARATPGRKNVSPFRVIRAVNEAAQTYLSSDPNQGDELAGVTKAARSFKLITHQDDACVLVDQPILDLDYKTAPDGYPDAGDPSGPDYAICSRAYDKHFNPDLYKDFRGLQNLCLELGSSHGYVVNQDWSGSKSIPLMNEAEHFLVGKGILEGAGTVRAGVTNTLNVQLCTTGDVVGFTGTNSGSNDQINVSGWAPPHGGNLRVYYSVRLGDDSTFGGRGLMVGSNVLQTFSGSFTQGTNDTCANARTVVITPGFSSVEARHVVNPYVDHDGAFEPDLDTFGSPIDPPHPVDWATTGAYGMGRYVGRMRDSHCVTRRVQSTDAFDPEGFAKTGASPAEDFKVGDHYAFIGDTFFGPSIRNGNGFFTGGATLAAYYDRLRVGRLSDVHQAQRDAMQSGNVLDGGTFWFRSDKHWLDDPKRGGIAASFAKTVASGSVTSATFSLSGAEFAYFDAGATSFGTNGLLVNWVFEVDRGAGTNSGLWSPDYVEKRMLTSASTNSTSATIHWTEAMSASPAGLPGRIRRPYYLNPYAHGKVMLTPPGTSGISGPIYATVRGSLDDWVFVQGNTNTLGAGWQFQVIDHKPGATLTYMGTAAAEAWVNSTGSDTARIGVVTPRNFTPDPRMNLETHVKRYGLAVPWQIPTTSLYNELWAMTLALQAIENLSVTATNQSSDVAAPATNQRSVRVQDISGGVSPTNTASLYEGALDAQFAARTDGFFAGDHIFYGESSTVAAPQASVGVQWIEDPTESFLSQLAMGANVTFAWYKVGGISNCRNLSHTTTVYAKGIIQAGDPDQQPGFGAGDSPPLLFMPGSTGLLFRRFAAVASSGGSNTTEYTGMVGDTAHAPWLNGPLHTFGDGSTGYDASGGYVATNPVAVHVFDFAGAAAAGY